MYNSTWSFTVVASCGVNTPTKSQNQPPSPASNPYIYWPNPFTHTIKPP